MYLGCFVGYFRVLFRHVVSIHTRTWAWDTTARPRRPRTPPPPCQFSSFSSSSSSIIGHRRTRVLSGLRVSERKSDKAGMQRQVFYHWSMHAVEVT